MKLISKISIIVCISLIILLSTTQIRATNIYEGQKDLPSMDFIDISSWQGGLTLNEFKKLKKAGIKGVVVKVTEGQTYINPYAYFQIKNAKEAGLKVSGYHFSRYRNIQEAELEAEFFYKSALKSGLEKNDVFVNDVESSDLLRSSSQMTAEAIVFKNKLIELGIENTDVYLSEYWKNIYIDLNLIGDLGWVASYPYIPSSNQFWNFDANAWQWTDKFIFSSIPNKAFDVSKDYTGMYTNFNYNKKTINVMYSVKEGDTLSTIGQRFEIDWIDIALLNQLEEPYLIFSEQKLFIPMNKRILTYTIVIGDTFTNISEKLSIDLSELMEMNPQIKNHNLIFPGSIVYYKENTI